MSDREQPFRRVSRTAAALLGALALGSTGAGYPAAAALAPPVSTASTPVAAAPSGPDESIAPAPAPPLPDEPVAARALAHEIPTDVTVLAFVRPEADRLHVLVRVPLEAMRDMDFPLRGPGYLDIAAARPLLPAAARIWIADYVRFFEEGEPLGAPTVAATRLSLPSDRSFASYEAAAARLAGPPLPDDTEIVWEQAMLDVRLEYEIASDSARFSVEPELAHLGIRTLTVLRFKPPDGAERAFQYTGDPGLVRLDPRWHQAALQFVELGVQHILAGLDHLLFLLCLVIPFRKLRGLLPVITAFTVAHSITLLAAAFGLAPSALWFPPLIEALIALSIVYMAIENIVGAGRERRWMLAFGFGLVHGFGFSFALGESLQFAGSHLVSSLLAFNVGVEVGQILAVALMIPVLELAFRRLVKERMGTIIVSALVAHTAWHWMTARGGRLLQYEFGWPAWDTAFLVSAMRWTLLLLIILAAGWLLGGWARRLARSTPVLAAETRGGAAEPAEALR